MGNRANILLKEEGGGKIYLYTHWGGSGIKSVLGAALDRGRDRWGDEPYLSRIIFSEMVRGDIDGVTGYGLSTYIGDGDHNIVEVDMKAQTADGLSFEDFIAKNN